ncbi:MAG: glycoside hydrolase family 65 [Firmicutes bacterium]|nr:glycoside hydrolase family 65 [Bacillota bacterium]
MINREKLVTRHNPKLAAIDYCSPFTVGNGNFAFTADITGMQTLYSNYEKIFPLCTMAEWAWHTTSRNPNEEGDLILTEYNHVGRTVRYPVDKKLGNEGVYNWLRHNPHKFNLARIFLVANGKEISAEDIVSISQVLHIYEGRLQSNFTVNGQKIMVETICDFETDTLGFSVKADENINIRIAFPYGFHGISASDWSSANKHFSTVQQNAIMRQMDDICYFANFCGTEKISQVDEHIFELDKKEITVNFCEKNFAKNCENNLSFDSLKKRTILGWHKFWQNCGIVDFSQSTDKRAAELERRVILSLYLCRIQSCGNLPPAETGLTLNSWYGRFHLEMHPWHSAFWAIYGNFDLLEKSFAWYKKVLPKAKANAQINGYKGARWQKQVCPNGTDSPSLIAPLLVWQQPHILYMLDLVYKNGNKNVDFLAEYWEIIKETADFMCDFLHYENGQYNLVAPLIPAQEEHNPIKVKNPTFELEYFRYGLKIAVKFANLLNFDELSQNWQKVYEKIAKPSQKNGVYLAHENCPTTFVEFNRDHPSMLGALGFLPKNRVDETIMQQTLQKVLECWQMETMWGWDFAMMSMTANLLGLSNLAVDLLLMETPKNVYLTNGNNFQQTREDLPLYLPGNGSLLWAVAKLLNNLPNGWSANFEGIVIYN